MPVRYHQPYLRTGRQIGPPFVVRLEAAAAVAFLTGQPHGAVMATQRHSAGVQRVGARGAAVGQAGDPRAVVKGLGTHAAIVTAGGNPRAGVRED